MSHAEGTSFRRSPIEFGESISRLGGGGPERQVVVSRAGSRDQFLVCRRLAREIFYKTTTTGPKQPNFFPNEPPEALNDVNAQPARPYQSRNSEEPSFVQLNHPNASQHLQAFSDTQLQPAPKQFPLPPAPHNPLQAQLTASRMATGAEGHRQQHQQPLGGSQPASIRPMPPSGNPSSQMQPPKATSAGQTGAGGPLMLGPSGGGQRTALKLGPRPASILSEPLPLPQLHHHNKQAGWQQQQQQQAQMSPRLRGPPTSEPSACFDAPSAGLDCSGATVTNTTDQDESDCSCSNNSLDCLTDPTQSTSSQLEQLEQPLLGANCASPQPMASQQHQPGTHPRHANNAHHHHHHHHHHHQAQHNHHGHHHHHHHHHPNQQLLQHQHHQQPVAPHYQHRPLLPHASMPPLLGSSQVSAPPPLVRHSTYTASSDTFTDRPMQTGGGGLMGVASAGYSDRHTALTPRPPTSGDDGQLVRVRDDFVPANEGFFDDSRQNTAMVRQHHNKGARPAVSFRRPANTRAPNSDRSSWREDQQQMYNADNQPLASNNGSGVASYPSSLERSQRVVGNTSASQRRAVSGGQGTGQAQYGHSSLQRSTRQQHDSYAASNANNGRNNTLQQNCQTRPTSPTSGRSQPVSQAQSGNLGNASTNTLIAHQLFTATPMPPSSLRASAAQHLLASANPYEAASFCPLPAITSHRTNSPWMRMTSIVMTPVGIVIVMFIVVSPLLHYLM